MKISDLTPGVYFDGKKSLRLFVRQETNRVVYRKILCVSQAPQILDGMLQCSASDFAKWADRRVDDAKLPEVAISIAANAITLSPEQARALQGLDGGMEVRGKVRTSLLEKDLVCCDASNPLLPRLTELGKRVLDRLGRPPEKSA